MEKQPFKYPPGMSLYHCLDHLLTRPMFLLSFIFLLCMAGVLHRAEIGHSGFTQITRIEALILLWTIVILWPIFIAEAILRFIVRRHQVGFWSRLGYMLLCMLLPPVRMGAKSYLDTHVYWLPFVGWSHVDKHLRRHVEKIFSVPMIVIALMVLPLLALEYFYEKQVHEHFELKLLLDIGTAVIWSAFALELIIMLALAQNKLAYCTRNWIDVAVVLLPLLDFLPMLRLLRLSQIMSMQKLSNMGRLYRLRGLMMKVWRSFLALEVLHRIFLNTPEKRLRRMRELLYAKEEELVELREEIALLEQQVVQMRAEKQPVHMEDPV